MLPLRKRKPGPLKLQGKTRGTRRWLHHDYPTRPTQTDGRLLKPRPWRQAYRDKERIGAGWVRWSYESVFGACYIWLDQPRAPQDIWKKWDWKEEDSFQKLIRRGALRHQTKK
jgi:hypothetical protein